MHIRMNKHVVSLLVTSSLSMAGFGYQDELITSTDDAVRRIVLPTRVVYVFETPAAGNVGVSARTPLTVERSLVVAGGGGGGYSGCGCGGGGGGVIVNNAAVQVNEGASISLAVGAGGVGRATVAATGSQGGDSFLTIGDTTHTAVGGGYGGGWGGVDASVGGSGGGNAMSGSGGKGTAGQGHAGAIGAYVSGVGGNKPGGGGGAGEAGHPYDSVFGACGGEGLTNDITGVACVYGSGGGSGAFDYVSAPKAGVGGTNAGAGGASVNSSVGGSAVPGFGGGGGGGWASGGAGGSGVVILSVLPQNHGIFFVESTMKGVDAALSLETGASLVADGASKTCNPTLSAVVDATTGRRAEVMGFSVATFVAGEWTTPVWHAASELPYEHVQEGTVTTKIVYKVQEDFGEKTGFADDILVTTDASARRVATDRGLAYVFTNTGAVSVVLRQNVNSLERLIVAGGGGGAMSFGAGGGGGGVIHETTGRTLEAGTLLSVQIGAGGAAMQNGSNTVVSIDGVSQTAIGGGHGGNWGSTDSNKPSSGGSGGGGCAQFGGASGTAGQGYAGGSGGSWQGCGGGGGATEAGGAYNSTTGKSGKGGEGLACSITGVTETYGSGGGGGGNGTVLGNVGGTRAGNGGDAGHPAGYDADDGFGGGGGGNYLANGVKGGGRGGNGTFVLLVDSRGMVDIASSIEVPSESANPAIGSATLLAQGESLTASASNSTEAETGIISTCIGHTVERYEDGVWSAPVTNAAAQVTVTRTGDERIRITWLWNRTLGPNAAFSDRYLEVSGRYVSRKRQGEDYVYTFRPSEQPLTVLVKQPLDFNEALLVAGGGGGGIGFGGGGGGGGVIYQVISNRMIAGTSFRVQVGAGGAAGGQGGDSLLVLGGVQSVAKGGGRGGRWGSSDETKATEGGSGGGGCGQYYAGAAGTAGQGRAGGSGGSWKGCGGGGGATEAGGDYSTSTKRSGKGGEGFPCSISGVSEVYGSGGGGGGCNAGVSSEGNVLGNVGGTRAGNGGDTSHPAGYDADDGFGGGGGGNYMRNGVSTAGCGGDGTFVLRLTPVDKTRYGMIVVVR